MSDQITLIKPHHFVDIITSFGEGKRTFEPHPYGHAVHTISDRILHNPHALLQIELGIDDICLPCIHHVAGSCDDTIDISYRPAAPPAKADWNLLIDKRWCKRLELEQGEQIGAYQFCERIREGMGNMTDIYREIPVSMTASRRAKLLNGLAYYLGAQ